jgi:uncharacterized membrane protein HdeD (DUF308 family)
MLFVKVLGIVDILVGVILLFSVPVPGAAILFVILLGKGILSLMADTLGKVYGILDIAAGVIIMFNISTGLGLAIVLFVFFVYKGLVSLVPSG